MKVVELATKISREVAKCSTSAENLQKLDINKLYQLLVDAELLMDEVVDSIDDHVASMLVIQIVENISLSHMLNECNKDKIDNELEARMAGNRLVLLMRACMQHLAEIEDLECQN